MNTIKTSKVTNGVIYLDGQSMLGRAEEITCPEVAPKMVDHKGLGLIGEIELPSTSIGKMSMKIKWNTVDQDAMKKTHNPFQSVRIQVRASIGVFENNSKVGEEPCVIIATAVPKKAGGLVFKPNDNVEREDEFNVTEYGLTVNNFEIVYINVLTNIWRINGVDVLAQYRANVD